MADLLPIYLIHKILSYLSFTEATRLSILSKTWLQACSTLPNLEFTIKYRNNMKIVDNIMERYRDGKIPIEKFELSDFSYLRLVFPMFDKWLDIALHNSVKHIVFGVPSHTSYPLPIFKIFASKSLRELILRGSNLKNVSLSSGVVKCNSLRKLTLSDVVLDENMLQTLLNSCPFIVSFIFDNCYGLKKIELLNNLQKIKSVLIWKAGNQLVKIQAPTLEHLSYVTEPETSPKLDIVDAPNLVSLVYKGNLVPTIFVDAKLPWSCHPRRLLLESNGTTIAYFMDRLMYMKSSSQLKEVKVYRFDWGEVRWHFVELGRGKEAIRLSFLGRKLHSKASTNVEHSTVKFKLVNRNICSPISLHAIIQCCYAFPREFKVVKIQPGKSPCFGESSHTGCFSITKITEYFANEAYRQHVSRSHGLELAGEVIVEK